MPGKSLKCVAEVKLASISCPGVWLDSKSDLYLKISMFGRHYRTKRLNSAFPLLIFQTFEFEKIFQSCFDPGDLSFCLEREPVFIELLQLEPLVEVTLSTFRTTARKFLYPVPTLRPSYSGSRFDILFQNTYNFPSPLQPRLGYSTATIIFESRFDYNHPRSNFGRKVPDKETRPKSCVSFQELPLTRSSSHDFECTVCNLYKEYFGRKYAGHRHINHLAGGTSNNWHSHPAFFHSTLKERNRDDFKLNHATLAANKDRLPDSDRTENFEDSQSDSDSVHEIWSPNFNRKKKRNRENEYRYLFNKRQYDIIKAMSLDSLYD